MADYSYQKQLINETILNLEKYNRSLLAACPGAGKTRMTIEVIKRLFKKNKNEKILVFTHGQLLLREQWEKAFSEQKTGLKVTQVKSFTNGGDPLEKLFKENDILLALPQTLERVEIFPKFTTLVIDEAHHFCEADNTKKLIQKIPHKKELRLTGTPSIYIGKKEWPICGITIQELVDFDVLTDPTIELAKSEYQETFEDYNKQMELRTQKYLSYDDTKKTILNVLDSIKDRILNEKTMFVCRNQEQALFVDKYFKEENIESVLSISSINFGNKEIEEFKASREKNILIVVNRGTLGFDFDELSNVIDLSGTLNVNKLFQMLARVIRLNKKNPEKKKLFLKITSDEMSIYTYIVMSFVVALSDKQYYFTYKSKNTKNSRIPVSEGFLKSIKTLESTEFKKDSQKTRTVAIKDIPKLYTFKDIKNINNGSLNTYAMTTFSEVRKMLGNITRSSPISVEAALNLARGCKNWSEFRLRHVSAYQMLSRFRLLHLLDDILPRKYRKPGMDFNLEDVLELTKKYSSRSKFREAHTMEHNWLKKNNYIHLAKFKKTIRKWDEDTAIRLSLTHTSNQEIRIQDSGLYDYLRRKNLLTKVTQLRNKK